MKCPNCGYSNPAEMNFCGKCGTRLRLTTADGDESQLLPTLDGERRLATVVMADVISSTDLLEEIGTEKWVTLMSRVLQLLGSEIYRFGGKVDQFRGDGLVAFFGTKAVSEDDAERAVLAALNMQKAMERFAQQLAETEDINLQLRVGVNTGEVIVASIGDERLHSENTAMGGAISMASRLETSAQPGSVWASKSTYELVRNRFEWVSIGRVEMKGFRNPVDVFQPIAPRYDDKSPRSRPHIGRARMVGRAREFEQLKKRIQGTRELRQGGLAVLTGQRGMGKGLLLQSVQEELRHDEDWHPESKRTDGRPRTYWLRGRSRSYDQSWPYSMWLDMIRRWFDVRDGESDEDIRHRLRKRAERVWGSEMDKYYPWLASFLDLPLEPKYQALLKEINEQVRQHDLLPENMGAGSGMWREDSGWFMRDTIHARTAVERSTAELSRQSVFLHTRRLLRSIARKTPVIIVFEDMQWADETSVELLKYCLPLTQKHPLLFILAYRAGHNEVTARLQQWVDSLYEPAPLQIELHPLTRSESNILITEFVGPNAMPPKLRDLLVRKAEGNPYYLEELLHNLMRNDILARSADTGEWHTTRDVDDVELPDSLNTLIMARIDNLPAETRRVIQLASVIGTTFWTSVLEELTADDQDLPRHLHELERQQIIMLHSHSAQLGVEYHIGSSLLRDVAYQSILNQHRLRYHRQVAHAIEKLSGEQPGRFSDVLAYHYQQAEEHDKELQFRLEAAETTQRAYANAESISHYARALELLDRQLRGIAPEEMPRRTQIMAQKFHALNNRRSLYHLIGDWKAASADAQTLLDLAYQFEENQEWLVEALLQQPGVVSWRDEDELHQGVSMATQAFNLAVRIDDQPRQMHSLMAMARQMRFLGDMTATMYAEKALSIAHRLRDQHSETYILIWLGSTYDWSDKPERAQMYFEQAQRLAESLSDKNAEIELMKQVGLRAEREGDYHRLLTGPLERRLKLSRETGNRLAEAQALILQGQVQTIYLGDLRAGLSKMVSGRWLWRGTAVETVALVLIAHVLTLQGDFAQAQRTLEHAEKNTLTAVEDSVRVAWALVSAMWHNAQGDIAHWHSALGHAAYTQRVVREKTLLTRQFEMAASVQATIAHLGLAKSVPDEEAYHLERALNHSNTAVDIYRRQGYTQVTECVGEAVFYWHGRALQATGQGIRAQLYFYRAHNEMMRKHNLIPADSEYRQTFLNNLPLHKLIRAAHK